MKKKVAIVSCYFKYNYGSMLQAYATQVVLDNLKIENETINIDDNKDFKNGKRKYYLEQVFNFPFIKSKLGMIKTRFYRKINRKLENNIRIRNAKYADFKKKFKLTEKCVTRKELENKIKNYTDVIVGSDQLWLPVNVVSDYYTLTWVPENINKISLATSFGISDIPKKYEGLYKDFLTRINHISVRENIGQELIKTISGKDAFLACDPTLLLDRNEWINAISEKRIIEDKYIFCYFLGSNIEHRKFVERIRAKTGYKIVSINHSDEYVKYSDIFADEVPYDVGPEEWINLIRNAEYVCTDSFHGTIFSLINNKDFYTFERYKSKNPKISTNSRIYSLLDKVGLNDRLIKGTENVDEVLKRKIDFSRVNLVLESFRKETLDFLNNSLK